MQRKITLTGIALLMCALLLGGCLPGESPPAGASPDATPAPTSAPVLPPLPAPAPPKVPAPPAEPAAPPPGADNATAANSTAEMSVDTDSLVVPRISIEELKSKMDAGEKILVVDSRLLTAYEKVHISGAVSLPLPDMAAPYPALVGYDEIVTYCT